MIEENTVTLQVIVPDSLQEQIMHNYHDIPSAGHLGLEKCLFRIQKCCYWPALKDDLQKYIHQCDVCAARKPAPKVRAPLGQNPVYNAMEKVCVDVTGPLPETKDGFKYILVISDWFTKWVEAVPIKDQSAKTVAMALVDNFIVRCGVPLSVLSDCGTCFESKLFGEICSLLGITKLRTSIRRSQANAVVERFNRTLKCMLSSFCRENQTEWNLYLQQVLMAYRSSPHASTGLTPNNFVLERRSCLPMAVVIGTPEEESTSQERHTCICANTLNIKYSQHTISQELT